ncbi:MAG: pyrimidine 5'-nucleotidase, partial [Alphaproteobacteria bacterium]|nr:pyrimidine 5'-nucleotidase [Alphaproteobacteria bacterium]
MSRLDDRAAWVFDLDNTLYPASLTVYDAIGHRMTAYIQRLAGLADAAEAEVLRERYFELYGATVVGLSRHHACDPDDFMDDVHDVPLDEVQPDPDLARLLAALPARRFVFTN